MQDLPQPSAHRPHRFMPLIALAALALAAWAVGLAQRGQLLAWAVFAAAGAALAWAPGGAGRSFGWIGGARQARQAWEPAFVVLLLLLAAAFRFHGLHASPPGAHGHEGEMVSHTLGYLSATPYSGHVGDGNILWPSLIFYQGKLSAQLFGHSAEAWRYPGALWGVLGVLAFYFAARSFCAPWVAAVAALFFNAVQLNLAISRNFFPGSILYVSLLGGFGLLVQALRDGGWHRYLGAGVLAGMSLHGFVPGRPVWLLFALWLGWLALLQRRAAAPWRMQALFWAGFALIASPVLWFIVTRWDHYWYYVRSVDPSAGSGLGRYARTFLENAQTYLHAPFLRGDVSASEDIAQHPMLQPVAGALVALGLGSALAVFWRPLPAFLLALLLLSLAAAMLGGGFAHPTARRLMLAPVPAFLLAAFALQCLRAALAPWGRRAGAALVLAAFALAVASNAASWQHYFHVYAQDPDVWHQRNVRAHDTGEVLRAHPDARAFVSPLIVGPVTTSILLPKRRYEPFRGPESLGLLGGEGEAVLVAEPWTRALQPLLTALVPGVEISASPRVGGPDPVFQDPVQFYAYRFPAGSLRGLHGLRLDGRAHPVFSQGLPAELAGRRVRLEGALLMPGRRRAVKAELDLKGWALRVDGRSWPNGQALDLDGGAHRLELEGVVPPGGLAPLALRLHGPEGDLVAQRQVAALALGSGVNAEYRAMDRPLSAPPDERRRELLLHSFHYDVTLLPAPFQARYLAWLQVPKAGDYRFASAGDMARGLWVDGRPALAADGAPGAPLRLPAGRVSFELRAEIGGELGRRLPAVTVQGPGDPAPKLLPEPWLSPR